MVSQPPLLHESHIVLALIPLFPFVGFLINAFFGRRLSKAVSGGVACLAMIAVVRRVCGGGVADAGPARARAGGHAELSTSGSRPAICRSISRSVSIRSRR